MPVNADVSQFNKECVQAKIPIHNDHHLHTGNYHVPPNTKLDVITKISDTTNHSVLLTGNFNVSGFDWERVVPPPNSHFYSKLEGDAIYTLTCLLDSLNTLTKFLLISVI